MWVGYTDAQVTKVRTYLPTLYPLCEPHDSVTNPRNWLETRLHGTRFGYVLMPVANYSNFIIFGGIIFWATDAMTVQLSSVSQLVWSSGYVILYYWAGVSKLGLYAK